jgi:antirestriction protein ArdC
MEELVAQLGAAFVSVELGIVPDVSEDHVPYIASWLKVLKSDKKAIFMLHR